MLRSYAEYGLSSLNYDALPVDAPLNPTFPYAVSKALSYELIRNFTKTEGIASGYYRIFNAYGEGQYHKNFWPSLVQAAKSGNDFKMTHGEQIRDFVSVDYVAEIFSSLYIQNDFRVGFVYVSNLCSGNPISLKSFATEWWNTLSASGKLLFGEVPYRSGEIMRYVPLNHSKLL